MPLSAVGTFDEAGYLRLHPDVAAAGMNAWEHFKNHGKNENRPIALSNGVRGTWDEGQCRHSATASKRRRRGGWPDIAKPPVKLAQSCECEIVKRQGGRGMKAFSSVLCTHECSPFVCVSFRSFSRCCLSSFALPLPFARFPSAGYLAQHPDVKNAGMQGWTHFVNHGKGENRPIVVTVTGASGKFDPAGYYQVNPDVKAAGMDAFVHYTNHGQKEGRTIQLDNGLRGTWDGPGYHKLHQDVQKAGMEPFTHYVNHGFKEGRPIVIVVNGAVGKFDLNGYHATHPDVKAANMAPFDHWKNHGFKEQRLVQLSNGVRGVFDQNGYLALHPDVKAAGMAAETHFINHGHGEGRLIAVRAK